MLLGVYYAFCLLMFVHLLNLTYGYTNKEGRYLYPSFKEFIAAYNSSSFIKVPDSPIVMVLAVTVIFFIVGILFDNMLKITKTTQLYDETSKALTWGVRNFVSSGLFIVCIVMSGVLFFTDRLDTNWGYLTIIHLSIFLILLASLPFLLFNKKVLAAERICKWYKPMWPGLSPLLICVTGLIITAAINLLLDDHTILLIIWYVVDSVVTAILLSIFIYRVSFSALGTEIKSRMNLRFISAWILLDVKLLYYMAWLLPIISLSAVSSIFVYPKIHKSVQDTGSIVLWPVINFLFFFYNFFEKHYYIVLLPSVILTLLIAGRFLIQIDTLMSIKRSTTDAQEEVR